MSGRVLHLHGNVRLHTPWIVHGSKSTGRNWHRNSTHRNRYKDSGVYRNTMYTVSQLSVPWYIPGKHERNRTSHSDAFSHCPWIIVLMDEWGCSSISALTVLVQVYLLGQSDAIRGGCSKTSVFDKS